METYPLPGVNPIPPALRVDSLFKGYGLARHNRILGEIFITSQ